MGLMVIILQGTSNLTRDLSALFPFFTAFAIRVWSHLTNALFFS